MCNVGRVYKFRLGMIIINRLMQKRNRVLQFWETLFLQFFQFLELNIDFGADGKS